VEPDQIGLIASYSDKLLALPERATVEGASIRPNILLGSRSWCLTFASTEVPRKALWRQEPGNSGSRYRGTL